MEFGDVASIAAAFSATAAWVSAWNSRKAVARAHAPFVWPSFGIRSRDQGSWTQHSVRVRLHNDGPGVAYGVRFSLDYLSGSPDQPHDASDRYVIPPIPAMRSGEVMPPGGESEIVHGDEFVVAGPAKLNQPWSVVVRFADGAGQEWEVRAPSDPEARVQGPRQLRKRWWVPVPRPLADW
jgi:hypothetical protein